jgi:uncharacterized protein YkvS
MKVKIFVITGLAVLMMLMGVTSCSAADLKMFEGILQNADSISGNVTVTLNNGETITFNLADIDLKEILAASDNAGLEIGDRLRLRLHDNGEIAQVEFKNTYITGVIEDISGNNTITIITGNNEAITLTIDEKTLVVVHATGRTGISDLEVGQKVYVRYDTATMVAEKIRVGNDGPAWQNRHIEKAQQQETHQNPGKHQEQNMTHNQNGNAFKAGFSNPAQ